MLSIKETFSIIAIILTFFTFLPYIRLILLNRVKPHLFSWIIWTITNLVVFKAQLTDGGGVGSWVTGVSGTIVMTIAVLSYFKKSPNDSATKMDWTLLSFALLAVPLWYVTSDPMWSVIVIASVDFTGFFPTIRKSYLKPFEESLSLYAVMLIRSLFGLMALENYTVTTALFPIDIIFGCVIVVTTIILRRYYLRKHVSV